ncbi:MAG: hypothetical protein E7160_02895 [Firmicutes bacterium]|nr:hypothetical protein [Bacillota bacterium]
MDYLYRYGQYFCSLLVVFLFLFIIASGNKKEIATISNINNIKSVPVTNLSLSYRKIEKEVVKTPKVYSTFNEAINNVGNGEVSFYGKLTAYGPDCKGCGGTTACRGQNVRNGNIYYNDKKYGKLRILAADRSVPCGTVIRVNNINSYSGPIMAVVLDRGGAIRGNHLDLLFESQKNLGGFGTQSNIKFDIVRWGY